MSEEITRRAFVVSGLAVGFAAAVQPVTAQTQITTDTRGLVAGEVKFKGADGVEIPAYRAHPEKGDKFPVVLVIQEIFGVHEHIKDVYRRFAKKGYYASAPALYARQGDVSKIEDFRKIISDVVSKVPDAQVMSDLDAATAYVKSTGKANTDKLAITGFCWGGRITWLYAAHNPKLKAGVAWYGRLVGAATELQPKNPVDLAAEVKASVLGLYGGKDQGIPQTTIDQMEAALKAAGNPTKSEFVVYPDAEHGFHADYRPSYNSKAAKDGFERALTWFKKRGVA
ncbi:MAG: dienelactone hydrolase family protein [bacterium]